MMLSCNTGGGERRRGAAVVYAMVVMAVVAVLMAEAARHGTTARRMLENRRCVVQARWLARAGVELAAAKLLSGPADYTGEIVNPIPDGRVTIQVAKTSDAFEIRSTARYPVEGPEPMGCSLIVKVNVRTTPAGRRIEFNEPDPVP